MKMNINLVDYDCSNLDHIAKYIRDIESQARKLTKTTAPVFWRLEQEGQRVFLLDMSLQPIAKLGGGSFRVTIVLNDEESNDYSMYANSRELHRTSWISTPASKLVELFKQAPAV